MTVRQTRPARSSRPAATDYFFQQNRGACAARNAGLSIATGDFLQFFDSDDVLHPGKINRQVEALLRWNDPKRLAIQLLASFWSLARRHAGEKSAHISRIAPRNALIVS
jgi:glycosyltransferase involved in cell wall biosynthesis